MGTDTEIKVQATDIKYLRDAVDGLTGLAKSTDDTLRGIGNKPGLVARVAVVERDQNAQRWWLRSTGVLALGCGIRLVWAWVGSKLDGSE